MKEHSPSHSLTLSPRIFLGLGNIKSLESETAQLILNERRRHGRDYFDFLDTPSPELARGSRATIIEGD